MAVTSPDNIWTPDSGDAYALTVDLARMADDIQEALDRRPVDPGAVRQGWTNLTPEPGWSAGTGANAPQVSREGWTVFYRGTLYGGTPFTTAAILPTWARPTRTARVRVHMTDDTSGWLRAFVVGALQPSGNTAAESTTSWSAR